MEVEVDVVAAGLRAEVREVANGADVGNGETQGIEPGPFRLVLHVVGQADETLRRRKHVAAELREHRPA